MRRCGALRGTIGKLCLSNSIVSLMPALAFIHSYWFGKLLLISHSLNKAAFMIFICLFLPGVMVKGINDGVWGWEGEVILKKGWWGIALVAFSCPSSSLDMKVSGHR